MGYLIVISLIFMVNMVVAVVALTAVTTLFGWGQDMVLILALVQSLIAAALTGMWFEQRHPC